MIQKVNGVIDLETLGRAYNAPIVQIAISLPCEKTGAPEKYVFERTIKYPDGYEPFEIEDTTVDWWLTQPKEARENVIERKDKVELIDAMVDMVDFLIEYTSKVGYGKIYLWAHSSFDFPKLIYTLSYLQEKYFNEGNTKFRVKKMFDALIPYTNQLDFRTLDYLSKPVYNQVKEELKGRNLIHHYAKDDAIYEHYVLKHMLKQHNKELVEKQTLTSSV